MQAIVILNFFLFGFALSACLVRSLSGVVWINNQVSILATMGFVFVSTWVGAHFARQAQRIEDESWRTVVVVSTFVYLAGFLDLIFSPSSALDAFYVVPFALLAVARSRHRASQTGLADLTENVVNALCQIAALALLLRGSVLFDIAFAQAALVWAVCFAILTRVRRNAANLLQPVLVLWFFINLGNQVLPFNRDLSTAWFAIGWLVYLALTLLYLAALAVRPGWVRPLNRMALAVFAVSLLCDLKFIGLLSRPLITLDFHWWFHVAPGLPPFFSQLKPFIDYYPTEGVVWQTYISHAWFALLGGNALGYFVVLFALGLLGYLFYTGLLSRILQSEFRASPFLAWLLAACVILTNYCLLEVYFPHPYAWCLLERTPVFFCCALLFWAYVRGSPGRAAGFLLGAAHAVSFLFETTLGLAGGMALCGTLVALPGRVRHKALIVAGLGATLLVYVLALGIPPWNFFIEQPLKLLAFGTTVTDPRGQLNVLSVFFRDNLLSTLHHSIPLLVLAACFALLAFRAHRHRAFAPASYFFIATFSLYLSRGNQLFFIEGVPTPFHLVEHTAMALALFIPLVLVFLRILLDTAPGLSPRGLLRQYVLPGLVVAMLGTDGLIRARTWHAPKRAERTAPLRGDWDPGWIFRPVGYTWSLPTLLSYFYEARNAVAMTEEPPPLEEYLQRCSAWTGEGNIPKRLNSMKRQYVEHGLVPKSARWVNRKPPR